MFNLEILKNKKFIELHKNEEWFEIYDDNKNKIGIAPRSVCHNKTFLLHKVVHLLVFNDKNEILLQKRHPLKKIQPDKWDTSVGGHINYNETKEDALKRETKEELGIDISDLEIIFLYDYIMTSSVEKEWVFTFKTIYNGKINFQKEEITEVKFWSFKEIEENIEKNIFTPNFIDEFNKYKNIIKDKQWKKNGIKME